MCLKLRGVLEIGEKRQKSPHQIKLEAVVTLHAWNLFNFSDFIFNFKLLPYKFTF